MAGLQKITIIGNLGRDPEMRYTPNGSAVTSFSVAVSRQWKTPDGEQREETDWFNVSCWERLAEIANQYLAKGRQVYIEGRVKGRMYDDTRTGEKRMSMDVTATNLVLLGQRSESSAEQFGEREPATASSDFDNMPF